MRGFFASIKARVSVWAIIITDNNNILTINKKQIMKLL